MSKRSNAARYNCQQGISGLQIDQYFVSDDSIPLCGKHNLVSECIMTIRPERLAGIGLSDHYVIFWKTGPIRVSHSQW